MVILDVKAVVVAVFLSVALYNFLELNVFILTTFKRRRGLYFWSFVVATWGIAFNSIGYLLKHLKLTTNAHLYATLILIGWCTMITGQSVVLYSRLHLVMHNTTRLRAVLIMIVTNAVWLHIPVIVLVYGANSNNPKPYEYPYSIYEKIQLSVFVVQELIISGLYIWETLRLLRLEQTLGNNGTIQIMNHLIYVNVLVMLLDFTILGLEFANLYEIQTAWKPLAYSVKLKVEFSILNRLVDLIRSSRSGNAYSGSRTGPHSHGLALGTIRDTGHQRSTVQDANKSTRYEVHVGGGQGHSDAIHPLNSTVMKTTEVQVQSHSRRRDSRDSIAESGKEILAEARLQDEHTLGRSASTVSSESRFAKFENQSWR
ncbi:hypothetical protein FB567DRAFT_213918 [Paraphoma chrysanthemicola]|uniref:DUF7703 domain-containing protein n=1 Tax=Paraphoma chrysanthemicola TaxID=798071 RepID=A0A8K0VSA6_9PLEO|nr:hypothetical protein FB567DRAFT_213918 [Paraphoma chrysanthemicola]